MSTSTDPLDPYAHDPDRWGVSLAQNADLLLGALDAVQARSVLEVGAYAGDLTRVLAAWAQSSGAGVGAIDPSPQPALVQLSEEHAGVELVRETSLEALTHVELPDAIVLDGDHNWWTVSEELRLIAERAGDAPLPLVLFHDVCWPHARRDDYFDASQIPEDARHPTIGNAGGVIPADDGVVPGGLPYPRSAAHAGGPRNGVLTAAEDFAHGRDDVRLVVVPAFFGLGVLWSHAHPAADALAELFDPWDRNPTLERLEGNRVHQLAERQRNAAEIWRLRDRVAKQEAVLRRLMDSKAFLVAEKVSAVRGKANVAPEHALISREEIRRALEG